MPTSIKRYAINAVLLFAFSARLHAMEFTPEYPFNVQHETVSDVQQIGRVAGGIISGPLVAQVLFILPAEFLVGLYNDYKGRSFITLQQSILLDNFRFGARVGSVIGGLLGQVWYCQAKTSLYNLIGNQTFLDIIKADNAIHARAWLSFYNKAHTNSPIPIFGKTAYPACFAQHATIKNNNGHTALMLAAQYGSVNVAQVLLDAGADANAQDAQGKTALDYAIAKEHKPIIELLTHSMA